MGDRRLRVGARGASNGRGVGRAGVRRLKADRVGIFLQAAPERAKAQSLASCVARPYLGRVSRRGGSMSILQASIYDLKKLSPPDRASYGLRVLTTRYWLRGVCKRDL